MANLRDIRNRIESIKNTQQITRAMKMVAAAKLRKAQDRMNHNRPYASKMSSLVARLASNSSTESLSNPLLKSKSEPENALLIVIGSDRGLCGAFNNNLFKVVEKKLKNQFAEMNESGNLDMITIGSKPSGYFPRYGYNVIEKHPGFFDSLDYNDAASIARMVMEAFINDTYDEVYIAYNEFKTVISQNHIFRKILPIEPESLLDGHEDEKSAEEKKVADAEYIYEPDVVSILDALLPKNLTVQLWTAILESNAAEQGSRMAAMDNATENAKELEGDLRLEYNKARQQAITTEISEIVSGAQALAEG